MTIDWQSPFVIYRVDDSGGLTQVHEAANLKDAKYWLTYIAEPGDVLCRTPKNQNHSGKSTSAEYFCHKQQSGQPGHNEGQWREMPKTKKLTAGFPG